MRFPIFLFALVIFTGYLAVKRKKQTRHQEEVNEAFIERERAANATRKKDISNLDYLPLSVDNLPIGEYSDEELLSCENTLKELSNKKILNLSAYSNTDLKLMYGPANLNELSECDDNYHTLSTTLLSYAKREVELERLPAATQILEYAMSLAIDSSQIYLLLAELYQKLHTPEKIRNIETALASMEESFSALVLPKLKPFRIDA